jgi:N-acyl-L-homoserine lactone synthetase
MIRIIGAENREALAPELQSMHRHRKQVFVDFLKWDVPVIDGQYEIDQFDNDDAVYLLVSDPQTRAHLGSVRLLPTQRPHLMSEIFPFLCDGGPPNSEEVWEITRLCTAPKVADPPTVRRHLCTALMEYGLLHGIRRYVSVTHMAFLSQVLAVGWNCEPLGLPQTVNGEEIGAIAIDVSAESLSYFRKSLGLKRPLIGLSDEAQAA